MSGQVQVKERKPRVLFTCSHCGDEKRLTASAAAGRVYCSTECRDGHRRQLVGPLNPGFRRILVRCPTCQNDFEALPKNARDRATKGQRVYCSETCSRIGRATGMSERRKQMPPGKTDDYWRKAVRKRDGHRCRLCGFEHAVHVHHIVPRRAGGQHVDANLITLCPNHHAMAHAGLLTIAELTAALQKPHPFAPLAEPGAQVNYRS